MRITSGPHSRRAAAAADALEPRCLLTVSLVADVNPFSPSSDPSTVVPVGDIGYFAASDAEHGRELWKTDGTEAGTRLVADAVPGPGSLSPVMITPSGTDRLFFVSNNARDLWVSDGSEDGTRKLATFFHTIKQMVNVAGTLMFTFDTRQAPHELWKSDGTPEGTVKVSNLNRQPVLTAAGNNAFFLNSDPQTGLELWRSDGTAAGTSIVKDTSPSSAYWGKMAAVGSKLFFVRSGRLWRSDGTAAGTVQLSLNTTESIDIATPVVFDNDLYFTSGRSLFRAEPDDTRAGAIFTAAHSVFGLAAADDRLYFRSKDAADGSTYSPTTFWYTSGATGNVSFATMTTVFGHQTTVGNKLFFDKVLGNREHELWTSDGTAAGTRRVVASPDPEGSVAFTELNGAALYVAEADNWAGPEELWRSDGTDAGTYRVKDINPYPTSDASPMHLTDLGDGRLVFWAYGEYAPNVGSFSVYVTDGSAAGTRPLVQSKYIDGGSRFLSPIAARDGLAYFKADTDATGRELFVTDGTPAGSRIVADLVPGPGHSNPEHPFAGPGFTLFTATTPEHSEELWRTDGTAAGTYRLTDLNAGPGSSYFVPLGLLDDALPFFAHGPYAYFYASDNSVARLYRTDGTVAGTVALAAIVPGSRGYERSGLFAPMADGRVFLAATNAAHGEELWVTDGTPQGTRLVKDIVPGTGSSHLELPGPGNGDGVVGDRLYFSAHTPETGVELWVTDGTETGTRLVKDVNPGPTESTPRRFASLGDAAYFIAQDVEHGIELWRTDGTEAGTSVVRELAPGPAWGFPLEYHDVISFNGELLILSASSGTAQTPGGVDVYRSDGTAAGTRKIAHLTGEGGVPRLGFSGPFNGHVYFSTQVQERQWDPWVGTYRLWRTDGTSKGTTPVTDPDHVNTYAQSPVAAGDSVYVSADSRRYGLELWREADHAAPVPAARRREDAAGPYLVLSFNEPLAEALEATDVEVTDRTTGLPVPAEHLALSIDSGENAVRLTFAGHPRGVWPDGDYRLIVRADVLRDTLGNVAAAPFTYDFTVRAGDANGDGLINADDYFRIDSTFLSQPPRPSYAQGDFNYDEAVNADDYFVIDSAFLAQGSVSSSESVAAVTAATTADGVDGGPDPARQQRRRASVFSDQAVTSLVDRRHGNRVRVRR